MSRTKAGRSAHPGSEDGPAEGKLGTNIRRGLVVQEIYDQATRLFAERGFAGTSFQDIADAVGLTRPALYHYVSSKDELLAKLVAEITQDTAEQLAAIASDADLDAAEKLHEMVLRMARGQGEHADRFRLLIRSEADLPEGLAATHAAGRRSVLRSVATVIEAGVASGLFRHVDARIAALGIVGMSNWMAWWYRNDGRDDLERVCRELSGMAVAGLRADGEARPVASASEALGVLREDVERLAGFLPE